MTSKSLLAIVPCSIAILTLAGSLLSAPKIADIKATSCGCTSTLSEHQDLNLGLALAQTSELRPERAKWPPRPWNGLQIEKSKLWKHTKNMLAANNLEPDTSNATMLREGGVTEINLPVRKMVRPPRRNEEQQRLIGPPIEKFEPKNIIVVFDPDSDEDLPLVAFDNVDWPIKEDRVNETALATINSAQSWGWGPWSYVYTYCGTRLWCPKNDGVRKATYNVWKRTWYNMFGHPTTTIFQRFFVKCGC